MILCILSILTQPLSALEVRGANQSLDIAASARRSGTADLYLGMPGDLASIYGHPASLTDLVLTHILVSHYEHFEGAQYDHIAANIPLDSTSTLAFGLARFGIDGIPLTQEGVIYEGASYETFSATDYILSSSFAHQINALTLGASLHLLYRTLDQTGFGFRTDISAQYSRGNFRIAALVKGLTTSAATWEEGTFEYSPTEIYTGMGYTFPLPYFYGSFNVAWQSSGFLHHDARSTTPLSEEGGDSLTSYTLAGKRITSDPWGWLKSSSGAIEFTSPTGLALRVGIPHLHTPTFFSMGAGITLLKHTSIDYSFYNHPELSNTHHVSITIIPEIIVARHFKKRTPFKQNRTITPLPPQIKDAHEPSPTIDSVITPSIDSTNTSTKDSTEILQPNPLTQDSTQSSILIESPPKLEQSDSTTINAIDTLSPAVNQPPSEPDSTTAPLTPNEKVFFEEEIIEEELVD